MTDAPVVGDDAARLIVSFLCDPKDLGRVAQVSQAFYEAVDWEHFHRQRWTSTFLLGDKTWKTSYRIRHERDIRVITKLNHLALELLTFCALHEGASVDNAEFVFTTPTGTPRRLWETLLSDLDDWDLCLDVIRDKFNPLLVRESFRLHDRMCLKTVTLLALKDRRSEDISKAWTRHIRLYPETAGDFERSVLLLQESHRTIIDVTNDDFPSAAFEASRWESDVARDDGGVGEHDQFVPSERFEAATGVEPGADGNSSRSAFVSNEEKYVMKILDELANRFRELLRKHTCSATEKVRAVQLLNVVLLEEFQLKGSADDYYNVRNSLLYHVLMSKRGIPITLVVIYCLVAQRVGIEFEVVGLPGHVVLGVGDGETFCDVFNGGHVLSLNECRDIVVAYGIPWEDNFARATSWAEALQRVVNNVLNCYHMKIRDSDISPSELGVLMRNLKVILKVFRPGADPPGFRWPTLDAEILGRVGLDFSFLLQLHGS